VKALRQGQLNGRKEREEGGGCIMNVGLSFYHMHSK